MRIQKKRQSEFYYYVFCHNMAYTWNYCILSIMSEQEEHGQPIAMNLFWNEFIRQTTENGQSEFLQLS